MPPLKAGSRSFRHLRWVGADAHTLELVLLAVVLFAVSALGEPIEKWKTPAGTLYFGNRPPAGSTLLGRGNRGESRCEQRCRQRIYQEDPIGVAVRAHRQGRRDRGRRRVHLLVDRQQLRIRLAEIDTPEKGQPYGNRARQALSDLIFDRAVRVVELDRDRYGRVIRARLCGGFRRQRRYGS